MNDVMSYEEKMRFDLTKCNIPDYMHDGIIRYVIYGIEPGSFLFSLMINDLKQTFVCADDTNKTIVYNYVNYFYNYAPAECWGSLQKVNQWINDKGLHGLIDTDAKMFKNEQTDD